MAIRICAVKKNWRLRPFRNRSGFTPPLRLLIILLTVSFAAQALHAQEITLDSDIDWEKGVFLMTATVSLSGWQGGMPGVRYEAEQYIKSRQETLYREALSRYPADSAGTVMDRFLSDPRLSEKLRLAGGKYSRATATLDQGMRRLSVTFEYPLFGVVISPFVTHTRPNRIPETFGFVPTTQFTGILIYADRELPVIGENREQRLTRAFLPAIYTSDMDLLLSPSMQDPDTIKKWGVVGYAVTEDSTSVFQRVGPNPLRVLASALYGGLGADIVIPVEDARKLTALTQNRDLLRQGKIVIVTGAAQ